MLAEAVWTHRDILAQDAPRLRQALAQINFANDFSVAQAFTLSAAIHELRPRIILDLGTLTGNSAVTSSIAGERYGSAVFTFDLSECWRNIALKRIGQLGAGPWDKVLPIVGDLTGFDFGALTRVDGPVLLFWDAHGHAVAEHMLGHVMPLLADRPHLVVNHDIGDNRFLGEEAKEYRGKRFWRGMHDFDANPEATARINLGWATSAVDQVIPILDFCYRNDIELGSADFAFHRELDEAKRAEVIRTFPEFAGIIHMAFWSMTGTKSRRFPPPSAQFATASAARAKVAAA